MSNRFDYVAYDDDAASKQRAAKTLCQALEVFVDANLPKGRASSLVHTKLEEAYMWIGKAIRDEQVEKRGAELQENRSDE